MSLPQSRTFAPPPDRSVQNGALDTGQPIFLARQTYRRRRLMDAARLMPILAMVLFFLPTFWTPYLRTGGTANAAVYLFVVWAVLILLAGILARSLAAPIVATDAEPDQETGSNGA